MRGVTKFSTKLTILLVVLSLVSSTGFSQIIPSSSDLSYLLNPSAIIHLDHKVISKSSKKWILLEVTTAKNIIHDSLKYTYSFAQNLHTPIDNFKHVELNSFEMHASANKRMYAFESTNDGFPFLILRVAVPEEDEHFSYIINLEMASPFFITQTDLTIPNIHGFLPKGSNLKISNLNSKESTYKLSFYAQKFSAALPPMANLRTKRPFENADTTYILNSRDSLDSRVEGAYIMHDVNDKKAVSTFRISSKAYPQVSTINDLLEASVYLFTKKEKDKLSNSTNPKRGYDAFWLENTNSSERASKMISAYFSRVREANSLFSTFKEGWKTDMGMIYIIFGPPNKVFKNKESMEWVYQKTYEFPTLTFKFYSKSENLTTEYFELERNIKYQNTWFRAIDLWRKGRKNL